MAVQKQKLKPTLDDLREFLKEIEELNDSNDEEYRYKKVLKEDIFPGFTHRTLDACSEKKDFDSAMDCVELVLERGEKEKKSVLKESAMDVTRLTLVNNMKVVLHENKLYSGSDSSPLFTRAFGELGKQLEEAEGLRARLISGSVGGLVINLLKAAVFVAILVALWLVPPVAEWVRANPLLSAGGTVWLLTIIVFFVSGFSFSTAFGWMFLFWVAFVAAFGVGQYFVPEELQTPLAVILVKMVVTLTAAICILGLSGPIRRNFLAVANAREQRDIWERYSKTRNSLCRRCDEMIAEIARLRGEVNDEREFFLHLFLLLTRGDDAEKDKEQMNKTRKRLNYSLDVMGKYYEYIKEQV